MKNRGHTRSEENREPTGEKPIRRDLIERGGPTEGSCGGAGRVRTAASQFCRLLPYHLGTAPHEGGIIVASVS